MSDKNTVELILSAKNEKLINALVQGEKHIKAFGDKTVATFHRVGQSMTMFSNKIVTGMAAIGISYGAVQMGKGILDFDATLRRLRRSAGLSAEEIRGLRQDIIGLISPNAKLKIPLTKGQWADMAWELHATGIQLNIIKDILPQVGKGAVAAGVDNKIYAATIGELLDKYHVQLKDLPALQEQLNMAMKFPDVRGHEAEFLQTLIGMAGSMKLIGVEGIKNFTPLVAVLAQLSAEGAEGQASVNALIKGFSSLRKNTPEAFGKRKELSARGINFFNKDGSLKNIEELLPQIKKLNDEAAKSKKDISAVAGATFGKPEAGKALERIAANYQQILEKQRQLNAASGGLNKDFGIETEAMTNKLITFQNQLDTFNVKHMSRALELLSSALDLLNKHPLIAKSLLIGVGGLAGVAILYKSISGLVNMGRDIGNIWPGKGKGGLGGIAGAFGKGAPVYVTNWPGGFGGGSTLPGGGIPGAGGGFSKARSVLGNLGILGLITGAGIEASSLYLEHGGPKAYEKGTNVLNSMGPIGMFGKGMFDAAALISGYFDKQKNSEVKNIIKNEMNINIAKDRVTVDSSNPDVDTIINLNRGTQFGTP